MDETRIAASLKPNRMD